MNIELEVFDNWALGFMIWMYRFLLERNVSLREFDRLVSGDKLFECGDMKTGFTYRKRFWPSYDCYLRELITVY